MGLRRLASPDSYTPAWHNDWRPQEKIPTRLLLGRASCLGTLLGPRTEPPTACDDGTFARGKRSYHTWPIEARSRYKPANKALRPTSGKRVVENIHGVYDRTILLCEGPQLTARRLNGPPVQE